MALPDKQVAKVFPKFIVVKAGCPGKAEAEVHSGVLPFVSRSAILLRSPVLFILRIQPYDEALLKVFRRFADPDGVERCLL